MFRCSLTNDVEEQLLGIEDHGDSQKEKTELEKKK